MEAQATASEIAHQTWKCEFQFGKEFRTQIQMWTRGFPLTWGHLQGARVQRALVGSLDPCCMWPLKDGHTGLEETVRMESDIFT